MDKYKKAKDYEVYEKRTPISARIPERIKKELVTEAKKGTMTVSELIEFVLIDYINWINKKK